MTNKEAREILLEGYPDSVWTDNYEQAVEKYNEAVNLAVEALIKADEEIEYYKEFVIEHCVQDFKDGELTLSDVEDVDVLIYTIDRYTVAYLETFKLEGTEIWDWVKVDENWDELAKGIDRAIRATIREKWDKYLKGEN